MPSLVRTDKVLNNRKMRGRGGDSLLDFIHENKNSWWI